MQVKAFRSEGRARLSYLVIRGSEALVVDPQSDTSIYLAAAHGLGVHIKLVLETHFCESFVSGSASLSEQLAIPIYRSKCGKQTGAGIRQVSDGDIIEAEKLKVSIVNTPGLNDSSVCYLVSNPDIGDQPMGLFTGAMLCSGAAKSSGSYPFGKRYISPSLYGSLDKLRQLPDDVIVYPAYAAGSVCGSSMAEGEFATLGHEKRHNPLLGIASRNDFSDVVISQTHRSINMAEQSGLQTHVGYSLR